MARIENFNYEIDLNKFILWRFENAEKIKTLLKNKQDWLNKNNKSFWDFWQKNIFSLETANEFGLAVWAIILGIPLHLVTEGNQGGDFFGFGTPENSYKNLNNGNFADTSGFAALTLEEKRTVLRLRYFKLISRGAIPETNRFFKYLLGGLGKIYIADGLNMSITVVFNFTAQQRLIDIFEKYDLIPRPAGVLIKYIDESKKLFGFGTVDNNYVNLNNGGIF